MQTIIDWLNEDKQDYYLGVKLYMQFGGDTLLKKSLAEEKESIFKRQKLRAALKQTIIDLKSAHQTTVNFSTRIKSADGHNYWPPFPITDKIVEVLYHKWKPLYISMVNMQARLYDLAVAGVSDKNKKLDACTLAHGVLDLDKKCDFIYKQRDYYYVHGKLPNDLQKTETVGDPIRWATLMKNAERYVREFKLKLKLDPNNEKLAATLKKHQDTVLHYKNLLKL